MEERKTDLNRRAEIWRLREAARAALDVYGIEPASISLLAHFYHTTFKVTGSDKARYVLHILRPEGGPITHEQSLKRVRSELWWLDRLREDLGLEVPVVVRAPDGEGVLSVRVEGMGVRRCTLFRWIEGRFLSKGLRPAHLEAVGRLTARLHEHSEGLVVPAEFDRPVVDGADRETEERLAPVFSRFSVDAEKTMRGVMQRVREVQEDRGSGPAVFGLIHADIHQKNYLFPGSELGLMDFGDCGWGHHLYDFAVTMSEIQSLPRYPGLRAALLKGYRQVRELSSADEARIDVFFMLRRIQDLEWFLSERHNPSLRKLTAQVGERVRDVQRMLEAGA
jgi:Ser/Thr protein kinase RdoA (MazF antagonist)